MLCQRCHKNPASVRYTEVVDGKSVHTNLCPECMNRCEQDVTLAFSLGEEKPTVRSASAPPRPARRARRACPSCGITLDRVVESAAVGCAQCYDNFGQEIESVLEGLHRALHHQGKARRIDDTRVALRADLQSKRVLLKSALQVEDYEQAARLRDEIRQMESGLRLSEAGTD